MKGLRDLLGLEFFEEETLLTTGSQVLIPSLVQVKLGHQLSCTVMLSTRAAQISGRRKT